MPQLAPRSQTDAQTRYQTELNRLRSIRAERFAEEDPPCEPFLVALMVVPEAAATG